MAIPYMGSKRKLAKPILDYICTNNPNAKYFFDLFGGGGAVSFEALKRKQFQEVHYNELNTGVTELLKKIRDDGVTDEFYRWVSREEFKERCNEPTWWGGFLATCWSFGNNQKGYLYGKEIENDKKAYHDVCVNLCKDSLLKLNELTGANIPDTVFDIKGVQNRRLFCRSLIQRGHYLEAVEHLKRLQHLLNLQNLKQLQISNLSYELVQINTPINETVIYCDPPYKDTGKYQKDIDHDIFIDFVKSSPYKIYVSSYEFDLPCVFSMQHRSTLSATSNNKVTENLYCNKLEIPVKHLTLF